MKEILEILCGIIVLVFAFHYYYKLKFDFWKKHGIPGPKPIIYFGTAKDMILQKKVPIEYYKEIYDEYKHASLVGFFIKTNPILMINDPVLIKDVLITDSMIFTERGIPYSKKGEPIMDTLFWTKGEESLHLKAKLSPLFTPSKLKNMLSLLIQRSEAFKNWLDNSLLLKNKCINCSELADKLTADYSSVCLLNYDIKSFQDEENEICKYVKRFNKGDSWKYILKQLLPDKVIYNKLYDLISYYLFDAEVMQFCIRFAMDIVNYRGKHNIVKYDVINVLKEFKKNKKSTEKVEMLDQYFVTQLFVLFLAAYDTSAKTISNALYELALNHTIQNRLREEIRNIYIKITGEITFDDMNTMFYLDAVCKETLRKYSIADVIMRQASSAYTFRNSQLTIPKGQVVNIPVHAIHLDPDIYPKPEIFDPERFIGEATRSRQSMHYIPFGYGPRNCLGERFGLLQFKMGLITFLRNYKLDVCEKTPRNLKYISAVLVQQPKDIYLKITKIE
ncbi:Cytochrome P450 6B1 [Trachymyrmex septentrionalis]|uniref:Cytochrome P450 6B1 n=1 Tax=Trachymyrmex septentrionalis TaxID=34720 RepID=A0A195FJP8_9HYME|nr:PREDICTED: cytochrome P450 6B1-like [Trachymyrmex septentrionalis]KYN40885.1 Cytochrome P450 6B1 [Trachymyrmex septentrionalis]